MLRYTGIWTCVIRLTKVKLTEIFLQYYLILGCDLSRDLSTISTLFSLSLLPCKFDVTFYNIRE